MAKTFDLVKIGSIEFAEWSGNNYRPSKTDLVGGYNKCLWENKNDLNDLRCYETEELFEIYLNSEK